MEDVGWRLSTELLEMQLASRKPISASEVSAAMRIGRAAARRIKRRKAISHWASAAGAYMGGQALIARLLGSDKVGSSPAQSPPLTQPPPPTQQQHVCASTGEDSATQASAEEGVESRSTPLPSSPPQARRGLRDVLSLCKAAAAVAAKRASQGVMNVTMAPADAAIGGAGVNDEQAAAEGETRVPQSSLLVGAGGEAQVQQSSLLVGAEGEAQVQQSSLLVGAGGEARVQQSSLLVGAGGEARVQQSSFLTGTPVVMEERSVNAPGRATQPGLSLRTHALQPLDEELPTSVPPSSAAISAVTTVDTADALTSAAANHGANCVGRSSISATASACGCAACGSAADAHTALPAESHRGDRIMQQPDSTRGQRPSLSGGFKSVSQLGSNLEHHGSSDQTMMEVKTKAEEKTEGEAEAEAEGDANVLTEARVETEVEVKAAVAAVVPDAMSAQAQALLAQAQAQAQAQAEDDEAKFAKEMEAGRQPQGAALRPQSAALRPQSAVLRPQVRINTALRARPQSALHPAPCTLHYAALRPQSAMPQQKLARVTEHGGEQRLRSALTLKELGLMRSWEFQPWESREKVYGRLRQPAPLLRPSRSQPSLTSSHDGRETPPPDGTIDSVGGDHSHPSLNLQLSEGERTLAAYESLAAAVGVGQTGGMRSLFHLRSTHRTARMAPTSSWSPPELVERQAPAPGTAASASGMVTSASAGHLIAAPQRLTSLQSHSPRSHSYRYTHLRFQSTMHALDHHPAGSSRSDPDRSSSQPSAEFHWHYCGTPPSPATRATSSPRPPRFYAQALGQRSSEVRTRQPPTSGASSRSRPRTTPHASPPAMVQSAPLLAPALAPDPAVPAVRTAAWHTGRRYEMRPHWASPPGPGQMKGRPSSGTARS